MIATMDEPNNNNTMTFICGELSNTMFQKLYEQKKSNRFCDLTLHVNNKIIKAHRNVLACSSPYFDSILKHHKIIREQLIITCLDSEIFNTILNYMYTGEITIQHSNVEELLKLADHFIITKVIEYCIEFLGTKLNLDNCLFTYFLTQRFKLKHLGNIVENWIVSHIDEICDGDEIYTLTGTELAEFFKNKSFSLPTGRALNLLSQWILHDLDRRECHFDKLIKCFNTNTFEPVEVFKHLDTCILYNKSELCMFRFLDYLIQNNWMLSNFKSRYDNLHVKYAQIYDNKQIEQIDLKTDKITVSEKNDSNTTNNFTSVLVKAKLRNKKQLILKRLMLFGLKPSLRMAALKMLTCKKTESKDNVDDDVDEDDVVDDDDNEKIIGIKCPICFTVINDSLLLEQHLALSHAKDVTYKCGLCTFVCQYHGDYLNHMKTHFSGPPYKCDFCDTTADQISKLISHRAQHLDESIFQCTFCSFKCRLKQNYVSHLKIHTPEKTFKCEQCTKSFRFKQNLDTHMLTHTSVTTQIDNKNLTCESCGFHTKFLSHMIAHKRIHAAGGVYRCSYPHCKYSTAKKNQLSSHTKTHNGVRPHSCSVCGRGFMEKSHLVRHERIHLEEKPFKCSNCDYASSRRDKLKEHFTRHHGENASAKVPYKARPMRNNPTTNRLNKQQDIATSTTAAINFTQTTSTTTTATNMTQPTSIISNNDIQELIMHHQNHSNLPAINPNYHHFSEPTNDYHHNHIHNQLLATTNLNHQRTTTNNANQHQNAMLATSTRNNHTNTATSTAAAVAAAMMLDPRFHHHHHHHNSANTVPYHHHHHHAAAVAAVATQSPSAVAMAVSSQQHQLQNNSQHHSATTTTPTTTTTNDYPTSLQNCMTLF